MGFDVHDPDLDVRRCRLLEASAGTGKTYAIQHMFTRLILEDPIIALDRMALITFTKKATQSLKVRLRQNLQEAINQMREGRVEWLYLKKAIATKSKEEVLNRLLEALLHFDQLRISTIHAFAASMLQRLGWEQLAYEEVTTDDFLERLIRLQLQTLDRKTLQSWSILELLRENYSWDIDDLVKDLAKCLATGLEIGTLSSNGPELDSLLALLKDPRALEMADQIRLSAFSFVGCCDNQGELKFLVELSLQAWHASAAQGRFLEIDRLIQLIESMQEENLKKRLKETPHAIISYFHEWKPHLGVLRKLRSKKLALEGLARRMRHSLSAVLQEDHRVGYDVLLKKLATRMNLDSSATILARDLDVLIVDEFQDTDPLQWDILKKFHQHHPTLTLMLVGDPKQSIYAFRQADIYTYMQARQFIESIQGSIDKLDTNYRSHPLLVDALNHLFDSKALDRWLWLPRLQTAIECPPVGAGRLKDRPSDLFDASALASEFLSPDSLERDSLARVQLFKIGGSKSNQAENLVQVIASSYRLLKSREMHSFAVLVSDHRSSREIQQQLQRVGIPSQVQRPQAFSKLPSTHLYSMILRAWLHPKDPLFMKSLWCLPIWETSLGEMEAFLSIHSKNSHAFWSQLHALRALLHNKGLGAFYEAWLRSPLLDRGMSIQSWLNRSPQGRQIQQQWRLLVSWLHQKQSVLLGEDSLDLIQKLLTGAFDEVALYRAPVDEDAIQILTIHASKGLEYDVVYSMGSASSNKSSPRWFQSFIEGQHRWVSHDGSADEPLYMQACDELDAEKARRLYVAWTRAREYLFVAHLESHERSRPLSRASASPMDLYMASWELHPLYNYDSLYHVIQSGSYPRFEKALDQMIEEGLVAYWSLPCERVAIDALPSEQGQSHLVELTTLDLETRLANRPLWPRMESFSSLVLKEAPLLSGDTLSSSDEDMKVIASDLKSSPKVYSDIFDEMGLLPKGREVGLYWHEVIQRLLQFSRFEKSPPTLLTHLDRWFRLQKGQLQPWQSQILEYSLTLLTKRIKMGDRQLVLKDLPPHALRLEKTFGLSLEGVARGLKELFPQEELFQLQGVIDAWIIIDNKVLFIDWKSNWLGPNREHYSHSAMLSDALMHRYDLQARIYSEAIESWKQFTEPLEFIGGLYIYLRGGQALMWCAKSHQFEVALIDE